MENAKINLEGRPEAVRATIVSKMSIAGLVLSIIFKESRAQVTPHNSNSDASEPRLLGHGTTSQNAEGDEKPAYYTPKCPEGTYDSTCGNARWFACAVGCPGGAFGDSRCMCACQWGEPKRCEESTRTPTKTTALTTTLLRTSALEVGANKSTTSTTTSIPKTTGIHITTRLASNSGSSTTPNVTNVLSTIVKSETKTTTTTENEMLVSSASAASEGTDILTSTPSLRGSFDKAQSLQGHNTPQEYIVPSTSKSYAYTSSHKYFPHGLHEQDHTNSAGSTRTLAERSISPEIIPWLLIGGFFFAACCAIACLLLYVHKIRPEQTENTVHVVSPTQSQRQGLENTVRGDLTLQKAFTLGDRNAQLHQPDVQALPNALDVEESSFYPGDFVRLQGLAAAHLNGKFGQISGFNVKTSRFDVRLVATDEMKAVRPCNLIKHFSVVENGTCPKLSSHSSDSSASTRMPSPEPSLMDGQS